MKRSASSPPPLPSGPDPTAGRCARACRGIDVVEVPAPALVPLVEAGKIEGDEPREAVAHVCGNLPIDLEAVYLRLHALSRARQLHFVAALGDNIALIDPASFKPNAPPRCSAVVLTEAERRSTRRAATKRRSWQTSRACYQRPFEWKIYAPASRRFG